MLRLTLSSSLTTSPVRPRQSPRTSSPTGSCSGEIKAAREQKVASNISTAFAGLNEHSSVQDIGAAWNPPTSRPSTVSSVDVCPLLPPSQQPKRWPKSWRIAVGLQSYIKLKQYAPNPNTPNLTLGKQYGDLHRRRDPALPDKSPDNLQPRQR